MSKFNKVSGYVVGESTILTEDVLYVESSDLSVKMNFYGDFYTILKNRGIPGIPPTEDVVHKHRVYELLEGDFRVTVFTPELKLKIANFNIEREMVGNVVKEAVDHLKKKKKKEHDPDREIGFGAHTPKLIQE